MFSKKNGWIVAYKFTKSKADEIERVALDSRELEPKSNTWIIGIISICIFIEKSIYANIRHINRRNGNV